MDFLNSGGALRAPRGRLPRTGARAPGPRRTRRGLRTLRPRPALHRRGPVPRWRGVRDSGGDAYEHWPATLLAKVEFGKRWTFGDDYTRQHFGMYKRRFIRHHRRDRHYDFSQDFELPEFRERLLVEMYPGAKPRHASTGWYWVANLLLLTTLLKIYPSHTKQ